MRDSYRFTKGILVAIGLLWIVVTLSPLDEWSAHRLAGSFDQTSGQTLIVLGGSQFGDDIMGWSSYLRSVYARDAFRRWNFSHVVIVGGTKKGIPISELMKEFLVSLGVPQQRILTETASLSTRENALNVVPILRNLPGPYVLLTSDYHMFRAERVFEKAGVRVIRDAVPDVAKRSESMLQRWNAFCDLALEAVKIGYYSIRRWM